MKTKGWVIALLAAALALTACSTPDPPSWAGMPTGPDAVWDLVIIGDSSMWRLGDALASQIEEDVGVDRDPSRLRERRG